MPPQQSFSSPIWFFRIYIVTLIIFLSAKFRIFASRKFITIFKNNQMERYRIRILPFPVRPSAMVAVCAFLMCLPLSRQAFAKDRLTLNTVVIDAGHGGKDAGCVSKDRKTYEKNLTLSLAKRLGEKITKAYPDVKVIYTRSDDKYIALSERAEIANRNNANLFISIHINSVNATSPHGFSTHILGQSSDKNRDLFSYNMDVCRRENSVILMEEDYTTTYQGFDPNDPESFIFFNLMQNAYYEQSLLFAAEVDEEMSKSPISHSRGIWQDPFLVLWKTKMPAVLIEAGFISNSSDLKTLRSAAGQDAIAQRLFNAFKSFKTKYDGSLDYAVTAPAMDEAGQQAAYYGIQIFALGKRLPEDDSSFKGYEVEAVRSGTIYKYVIPASSKDAAFILHDSIKNRFPGSFVVKVDGSDVRRQAR